MGRVYGGAKPPKDEYRRPKAKRSMEKSQPDAPLAFYFKKTSCIMDSLYTHTHTQINIYGWTYMQQQQQLAAL
jgi:hypothetical protein